MTTKKRLIDADALLDRFWLLPGHIRKTEMDLVRSAPTVDAVEVVRCKDCTYFKAHNTSGGAVGGCGLVGQLRAASNFCSYGERREGE